MKNISLKDKCNKELLIRKIKILLENFVKEKLGLGNQLGSGFSYEDLPSNFRGLAFGRYHLNQNQPLSQQFASYTYSLGGSDNPLNDIPVDVLSTIPQNEESKNRLPFSKIQLNPFGKALPVTGKSFFDKTKQFFFRGSE